MTQHPDSERFIITYKPKLTDDTTNSEFGLITINEFVNISYIPEDVANNILRYALSLSAAKQ